MKMNWCDLNAVIAYCKKVGGMVSTITIPILFFKMNKVHFVIGMISGKQLSSYYPCSLFRNRRLLSSPARILASFFEPSQ